MKPNYRPRVDGLQIHWDWEMESQEADNCQYCYASAQVSYPTDPEGHRRLTTFHSGGLGGIDPDSTPLDKREFEDEQILDLYDHLSRFGVDVKTAQWDRLITEARAR